MNKTTYYIVMIFSSICILGFLYLFSEKEKTDNILNDKDKRKIDTVRVIEKELISPDSILFIKFNNVELKSEPSVDASTKEILSLNAIFFIKSRSENLMQVSIKGKGRPVEDFWYEITDLKGMTGWIFGYYTSKSLSLRKFR